MACNRLNASLTSSLEGQTTTSSLQGEFANVSNPKFQEFFFNQTVYPAEVLCKVSGSFLVLDFNKKDGVYHTETTFHSIGLEARLTGSTELSLCTFGYQAPT